MKGLNYLDLTFWALGGHTNWPESRGTLLYLFYAIPVIMQGEHGKSHPDKNLWSNEKFNASGGPAGHVMGVLRTLMDMAGNPGLLSPRAEGPLSFEQGFRR